ncbi:hypothetical protein AB0H43_26265 [Hamadaea sp. NPDC050747]|uniref:hypothetical protein n=1 Tax=Hamadaea sp. NPDC050747 TaxID=3155789 RepID=UPI0033C5A283
MTDSLTQAQIAMDQTAGMLIGRRIREVVYYGLEIEDQVGAWDFGDWHMPVMGVELLLDDGSPYSAVWDCMFGYFGLELYASPMTDHVTVVQPKVGGSNQWPVTEHPRWAPLLADPVTKARLVWAEGFADRQGSDGPITAPLALRLDFPRGTVRIIAAMEHAKGRWWLGADEVIVAFSREFTSSIGYPASG